MRWRWRIIAAVWVLELGLGAVRADGAVATSVSQADATAPWWVSVEYLERTVSEDPDVVRRLYSSGKTALHVAAERGDAEIVRRLIELGADVQSRDGQGRDALIDATLGAWSASREWQFRKWKKSLNPSREPRAYVRTVEALLAAGAKATVQDAGGWTALSGAVGASHERLVRLLLDAGADAKSVDRDGQPTLHLYVHHDEDATIYLNGVLAAQLSGFTADYDLVEMLPAARAALKPGKNLLAVHCRQTTGGQYIDVGLARVKE